MRLLEKKEREFSLFFFNKKKKIYNCFYLFLWLLQEKKRDFSLFFYNKKKKNI